MCKGAFPKRETSGLGGPIESWVAIQNMDDLNIDFLALG